MTIPNETIVVTSTSTALPRQARLRGIVLNGTADCSAILDDDGTTKLTVRALANDTVAVFGITTRFATNLHVTLTGAGAEAYLEYE